MLTMLTRAPSTATASAARQHRAVVARASWSPLQLLEPLIGRRPASGSQKSIQKREQLLALLRDGGRRQEIDDLLDELVESQSQGRLNEKLLAGGPWQVMYTRGRTQLWNALQKPATVVAKQAKQTNRASQDLDPSTRSLVSRADFFGPGFYVTASGTYTPLGDGNSMPVAIRADVEQGCLHIGDSLEVPLPIRGSGTFEVLYTDGVLRIFRSQGSYAVQVRQDVVEGWQSEGDSA